MIPELLAAYIEEKTELIPISPSARKRINRAEKKAYSRGVSIFAYVELPHITRGACRRYNGRRRRGKSRLRDETGASRRRIMS